MADVKIQMKIGEVEFSGEGEHAGLADLGLGVAALLLHPAQHVVDTRALPRVEQRVEEHLPAGEVPIEAAAGHAEGVNSRAQAVEAFARALCDLPEDQRAHVGKLGAGASQT